MRGITSCSVLCQGNTFIVSLLRTRSWHSGIHSSLCDNSWPIYIPIVTSRWGIFQIKLVSMKHSDNKRDTFHYIWLIPTGIPVRLIILNRSAAVDRRKMPEIQKKNAFLLWWININTLFNGIVNITPIRRLKWEWLLCIQKWWLVLLTVDLYPFWNIDGLIYA